jgi:hypothetical protein
MGRTAWLLSVVAALGLVGAGHFYRKSARLEARVAELSAAPAPSTFADGPVDPPEQGTSRRTTAAARGLLSRLGRPSCAERPALPEAP